MGDTGESTSMGMGTQPATRRDAIKYGLAALAAMGVGALAPAQAFAGTGNLQYGASNDAGADGTVLTSSNGVGLILEPGPTQTGSTLTLTNTHVSSGTGIFRTSGHCLYASQNGIGTAAVVRNEGTGTSLYSSASSGVAMYGQSATGIGVLAVGGLAPLRLAASGTAGAPSTGTHTIGELYVDSTGVLWSCAVAGTPGAWRPVLLGGADAAVAKLTTTGTATVAGTATLKGATVLKGSLTAEKTAKVKGDATFEAKTIFKRSGRKRVSKGKSSVTVTVPGGISTSANVLCTLQASAGTGVYIRYAKRTSATTFKIYLNKKATTSTAHVGWMVMG